MKNKKSRLAIKSKEALSINGLSYVCFLVFLLLLLVFEPRSTQSVAIYLVVGLLFFLLPFHYKLLRIGKFFLLAMIAFVFGIPELRSLFFEEGRTDLMAGILVYVAFLPTILIFGYAVIFQNVRGYLSALSAKKKKASTYIMDRTSAENVLLYFAGIALYLGVFTFQTVTLIYGLFPDTGLHGLANFLQMHVTYLSLGVFATIGALPFFLKKISFPFRAVIFLTLFAVSLFF